MSTCMYIHYTCTCTCTCRTLHCILFTFFFFSFCLFWLVSVWEHLRWRTLTPSLKRICLASVSSLSWISWILLLRRVSLVAMCSLWSISSYQSLPGKTDQKCTCMTLHWSGKFLLLNTVKQQISAQDLFMQIMPVKHRSQKILSPYVTMHWMLECINKNCINLSRGPFWLTNFA